MLFALSREELVASLGEEAVFVAPSGSLGPAAGSSPAARLLTSVGIPTGVFQPQKRNDSGRFPLVAERIEPGTYEAPPGCGGWMVFGCVGAALLPDTLTDVMRPARAWGASS
ncbi:SUKH-4 family immunity protein [Streptomyces sp. NPDC008125]|uniref:SUKH-4 family immunity protein n=1 Tax=Streptomyces sp. NPDC008125 TaxID=3364811 RepID=UPI0036EA3997